MKTTLAYNTTLSLSTMGRVLAIDLDSQESLSLLLGHDNGEEGKVLEHAQDGSGKIDLIRLEKIGRRSLELILNQYFLKYDYAVIDTPPTLGNTVKEALGVADYTVSPVTPDLFAFRTINNLQALAKEVQSKAELIAIPITMFDKKNSLHMELLEQFRKQLEGTGIPVIPIAYSIAVNSSNLSREPIPKRCKARAGMDELLATIHSKLDKSKQ